MIKCKRRQATDQQNLKNSQQLFSRFLFVEAVAIDLKNNRFHIPDVKTSNLTHHLKSAQGFCFCCVNKHNFANLRFY